MRISDGWEKVFIIANPLTTVYTGKNNGQELRDDD